MNYRKNNVFKNIKSPNTLRFLNNKSIAVLGVLFLLAGCSGPKYEYKNLEEEVVAIKSQGGIYKVGKPYTVLGQSYTPKEDYSYSETGIASWYGHGDGFNGKRTANGEKYNKDAITAAHRTLPLPSIVKITNLDNGKSIVARVNDRGPYVKNRIIDVSEKGATLLGYRNIGTARVKVEIIKDASLALKEAMLSNNNRSTASNSANTYGLTSNNTKVAEKVITPVSSSEEKGPFFVQVGSFADYDKAKQLAMNMERFGPTSIYEAYLSKNGVYRVRLGAYSTRDDATKILDRVLDYGHSDVTIVKD